MSAAAEVEREAPARRALNPRLIGIALVVTNLLGLWATPGQTKAREERRAWQELDRQRDEESRKLSERATQIQKDLEEHLRRAWPPR